MNSAGENVQGVWEPGNQEQNKPFSRGDGLHSWPSLRILQCQSGAWLDPTSSSTRLARGLFVVILSLPPLLIPGPVFACLAAKDKLQAFRRIL